MRRWRACFPPLWEVVCCIGSKLTCSWNDFQLLATHISHTLSLWLSWHSWSPTFHWSIFFLFICSSYNLCFSLALVNSSMFQWLHSILSAYDSFFQKESTSISNSRLHFPFVPTPLYLAKLFWTTLGLGTLDSFFFPTPPIPCQLILNYLQLRRWCPTHNWKVYKCLWYLSHHSHFEIITPIPHPHPTLDCILLLFWPLLYLANLFWTT